MKNPEIQNLSKGANGAWGGTPSRRRLGAKSSES